jgi:hypothetical protein
VDSGICAEDVIVRKDVTIAESFDSFDKEAN